MALRVEIDRLAWDDWNREHVRRHQVDIDEYVFTARSASRKERRLFDREAGGGAT